MKMTTKKSFRKLTKRRIMMSSMVLVVSSWLETKITSTGEKETITEKIINKTIEETIGKVETQTEVVLATFLLFQMMPQTILICKVGLEEILIRVLFSERKQ